MILSDKTIRDLKIIRPFKERTRFKLLDQKYATFGLSCAGYDIRVRQSVYLSPSGKGEDFALKSSIEKFSMPNNVIGFVKDKSSWARRGLSLFNTVIEPGWRGYLTLELRNLGENHIIMEEGTPIAQIIFQFLDHECSNPYNGKYQDQTDEPQEAI